MNNLVYTLTPHNWFTLHGPGPVLTLQDGSLNDEELRVQVRSGDYFATLATKLDEISQALSEDNSAESEVLQHLVNNLFYLQHYYRIIDKTDHP